MTEYIDRTQEPDEAFAKVLARFDAAPTPPEDAEAALIEATAAALAEDANAGAVFDPIDLDPEMYQVYEEDRDYFRAQARAALAVFRGQQDPAVQFAEWVVSLDDDDPESPGRQERRTVTLTQIIGRARAAIGGAA